MCIQCNTTDKGNGIIIPNEMGYVNKVEFLISVSSKFHKLDVNALGLCIKHEGQFIGFHRDTIVKKANSESD